MWGERMIKLTDGKDYPLLSDIKASIAQGLFHGPNFVNSLPAFFLATNVASKTASNGKTYYDFIVRDSKHSERLKCWDASIKVLPGSVVLGDYKYDEKYGLSIEKLIKVRDFKEALEITDEFYVLVPRVENIDKLTGELKELIESLKNPTLKVLLKTIFISKKTRLNEFFHAPAASKNHHVRIGGLLEHSLNVAKLCKQVSKFEFSNKVNKDLLITGALLHDIGKGYSYDFENCSFEMTDTGLLEDHMAAGIRIINKEIDLIDEFPENLRRKLNHIIVSHHGIKEWGSPVPPRTLEAIIIHNCDRLEAQMEAFNCAIDNSIEDEKWSDYISMLGTRIYKSEL